MRRLSITVLGPLKVVLDGAPVSEFAYNKLRALLAYLAVEAERPQTRAHLAALLWPDMPERLARQNLSQALRMLRKLLGEHDASAAAMVEPFLLATSDTIQLNPKSDYMVDATCFAAQLALVEEHPHRALHLCAPCIERLRHAAALYRGDLLAQIPLIDSELFDEWVQTLREQLRQQAVGVFERLARAAEWQADYQGAIGYIGRQLALAPAFEPGRRELMRLLALAGCPDQAITQYEQLRGILADEQAGEPELVTIALRDQIRALAPGAQEALRRFAPLPGNLPTPDTPLPGCACQLDEVCAQLRAGGIITIVGEPGIGKTCLALEAARALRFEFADGVYLVELAPLDDPSQVLPAIAQALGLPGPAEALAAHLREQHLLLLLDGFERVLEAAPAVAALLAACPAISVLATSQAPLRVRAERRFYLTKAVAGVRPTRPAWAGSMLGRGGQYSAPARCRCRAEDAAAHPAGDHVPAVGQPLLRAAVQR